MVNFMLHIFYHKNKNLNFTYCVQFKVSHIFLSQAVEFSLHKTECPIKSIASGHTHISPLN